MKKDPFYTLQYADGAPWLLPYGQAVASLRPGVRLNDSGALLWQLLDEAPDEAALAELFAACSGAAEAERQEALADASAFLARLRSLGLLETEDVPQEPLYTALRIGPLLVHLRGDGALFSRDFDGYRESPSDEAPHLTVTVTEHQPPCRAGAVCLLENGELEVYRGESGCFLLFPRMPLIRLVTLSAEGDNAVLYIDRPVGADTETLRRDLFHAIRHVFLYMAQKRGFFALHAASVLYRDRVWLFSAPSGTGKSTMAGHWQALWGTPVLNGDLALVSLRRDEAVFHPMPWCGTSGIAENRTAPLGGVVLLAQGAENRVIPLSDGEKQLRLSNRMISPVWTEDMLSANLAFARQLCARAAVLRYVCTKEPDAAKALKAAVDGRKEA